MAAGTTERDPWETGTGMVDDVDGYITEPFFGVDEQYNASAVLFCATLVDKQGEPITTIKYSVGEGWETNQDGSEILHPNKTQINKGSRFGYFIDRLAKPSTDKAPNDQRLVSPKGKENGLGLVQILRGRGNPTQAKTFEGLGFHWELHKGMTLSTEEDKKWKDVLYPTQYLGEWKGGSNAAAPAAPKGATAAAPTAAAPSSNGAAPALPTALEKRLTILALQNDARSFMKLAARDKEVIALPEDAMGYVLDTSAEGFHAKANA